MYAYIGLNRLGNRRRKWQPNTEEIKLVLIHIYIWSYTYIYIYTDVSVHVYVNVNAFAFVHVPFCFVFVCICIGVLVYIYIYICRHLHTVPQGSGPRSGFRIVFCRWVAAVASWDFVGCLSAFGF